MGQPGTAWRDIWAVVSNAARTPGDPLAAAIDVRAEWTTADYLLADMADSLRWLMWSKTKAAESGRDAPKPIPRPGDEPEEVTAMDVEDLKEFLARPRVELPTVSDKHAPSSA